MKLRAQRKIIKGKQRWYLVSSYRDNLTRTPRTRHHLYLGVPPNAKIEKLIDRINESMRKYGKPLYTGKEFQKIREINFRLRQKETRELRRIEAREEREENRINNAPERHQIRLRQRREIYALKKKLKPGERLLSHSARTRGPVTALFNKLATVRVTIQRDMFYEYGEQEKWPPELRAKMLEQFTWVQDFQLALNNLHTLRFPQEVEPRLSLEKARKVSSFAVVVSRLKATMEALKDMIQAEGQPRTWSESIKDIFRGELTTLFAILTARKN